MGEQDARPTKTVSKEHRYDIMKRVVFVLFDPAGLQVSEDRLKAASGS